MIPLSWYLIVAALLFCIGLYGVMARRNAVAILMAVELMLNAVNINLIAFWRYLQPDEPVGQVWAIFVLAVAAAEAAVRVKVPVRGQQLIDAGVPPGPHIGRTLKLTRDAIIDGVMEADEASAWALETARCLGAEEEGS